MLKREHAFTGQRRSAILPFAGEITQRARLLMELLALSHGLQLGDALIAATALERGLTLLSGNVKHFAAIDKLIIERFVI